MRATGEVVGQGVVAVVEVDDDGPGISPELRDRVFEPFYTTKEESAGTGLGLVLARAIVEDHGGSIAVILPPEEGWSTRVRIELPIGAAPLAVGYGALSGAIHA